MANVQIVIDANDQTIRQRHRGKHPTLCPIALKIDDYWFPNEHWDDFASVVLDWWIQQIADLRDGIVSSATLNFMDGPYEIGVRRIDDSTVELRCLERTVSGSQVRITDTCSMKNLESQIVSAVRSLLAGLHQAGLWNETYAKLGAIVDKTFGEANKAVNPSGGSGDL